MAPKYPFYTPYQFAGNMPINSVDLDGLEPKLSIEEEESIATILTTPPSDLTAYQAGVTGASWNAASLGLTDWFKSDPYFYSTDAESQRSYLQGRISGDLLMLGLGLTQINGGGSAAAGSAAAGSLAPAVAIAGGLTAAHGAAEATVATLDLQHSLVLMAVSPENRLRRDPEADGDHTTFKRDDNGNIYKYKTYKASPKIDPKTGKPYMNPQKRFDGGLPNGEQGALHRGVETPHIQGKEIKQQMKDQGVLNPTDVRRPTQQETPNNPRFRNKTPY